MDVGARIRELRKARGFSSRQLANMTNISQPVISRLETNTRSADVCSIEVICKALGISLRDFFDEGQQSLTQELQQLLEIVKELSPAQRTLVRQLLDNLGKC